MSIKIVNYKTGNLSSVIAALEKIGVNSSVISSVDEINTSDTVILPGVGSFDTAATNLKKGGFYDYNFQSNKIKVIGICLGFHLMCKSSDEGFQKGLSLFPVKAKDFTGRLEPVLHLGWSKVNSDCSKFSGKFYFCHRFFVEENEDCIAYVNLKKLKICNIMKNNNFWGIQSHPERSGSCGLNLLREVIFYES